MVLSQFEMGWIFCYRHYTNTLKCAVFVLRTYDYDCDVRHLMNLARSDGQLFPQMMFNVHQNFDQCREAGKMKD